MCWDCDNSNNERRDFRRGGSQDGWDDVPYRSNHGKAKPRPKKKPGCPENNNGAHVYVWTIEYEREDLFYKFFGYHKNERKICAGCGKRASGKATRRTERYVKKWGDAPWWRSPEDQHPEYKAYRERWRVQRGYTWEYYGGI